MLRRTTRHMRHNVVAYLALFLALSGSAMAAKPLIDGTDVQDGSLTGVDVQDDSLTGDDVDESSLDIMESTLGKVGDADTLDGKDSSQFGGPNKVVTSNGANQDLTSKTMVNWAFDLSPGKWIFTGKAAIRGANAGAIECVLEESDVVLDRVVDELQGSADPTENVSLLGSATFSSTANVAMFCDGPDGSRNQGSRLIALKVDP